MAWIIGKTCTVDTMSNKSPFYFPPVKSRKTHRGWLSAYPARLTSNWLNGSIIYYRSMLTWNGCVLGETRVSGDWSEHYRWNINVTLIVLCEIVKRYTKGVLHPPKRLPAYQVKALNYSSWPSFPWFILQMITPLIHL